MSVEYITQVSFGVSEAHRTSACPERGIATARRSLRVVKSLTGVEIRMTALGDAWEHAIQIPHDPLGVGVARGALRLILRAHGLSELLLTAELLASELVTNAHEHSIGPASLRVKWAHKTLRLTVWDTNPEPPRPVEAVRGGDLADSESGRGLWIVHELADR
ncbi:ATP-binding protein [Streptomyces sp. A5-4]|uniref:ATP-binding protein n=1 Tax=Streptomyces sp. A5-4 TaxID=3384771 RepID=UPI003DA91949